MEDEQLKAYRIQAQRHDPDHGQLLREAETLLAIGLARPATIAAIAGLDLVLIGRSCAHGMGHVVSADEKSIRVLLVKRSRRLAEAGLLDAADAARMEQLAISLRCAVKGYACDSPLAAEVIALARRIAALPIDYAAAGRWFAKLLLPREPAAEHASETAVEPSGVAADQALRVAA